MYGSDIIFSEYFRKFAHRNVNFPTITAAASLKYIESHIRANFTDARGRFYVADMDRSRAENLVELCLKFELLPRQIDEAFRLMCTS